MDQRVKLIVGAVAVVLILVIITIVVFLISSARQRSTTTTTTTSVEGDALNSLNKLKVTPTPAPEIGGGTSTSMVLPSTDGLSTYTGSTFHLKYPQNWGLLTCANSQNIELDPTDGTLLRGAICDYALKPVTFLVQPQKLSCTGETIKLGNNDVVKSKQVDGSDIDYRWCLNLANGISLDITHRVSPSDGRANSKEDHSSQVEDIIKTISTSPQGS